MCKANSFLLGVLPSHENYGGRTKGGSQTGNKGTSTPEGVPLPPYRREKGGERVPDTQNKNFAYRLCFHGLRQPTGNVASRQRIVPNPFAVKHTK